MTRQICLPTLRQAESSNLAKKNDLHQHVTSDGDRPHAGRNVDPTYLDGLGKRISAIVEQIGIDKSVQASGKSEKQVRRYMKGAEPPVSVLVALSATAQATMSWLADGRPQTSEDVLLQLLALRFEAESLRKEPASLDRDQLLGMTLQQTELLERQLELMRSSEAREDHSARDSAEISSHGAARTQQEHSGAPMLQVVDRKALETGALVLVPRLDVSASAGGGALVEYEEEEDLVAFSDRWLRERHITPSAARMLTAKGDSMEPTIRTGDTLIIDTSIRMAVDSAIYVVVYGGLLLVKRLFMLFDGGVVLSSDNKAVYGRDEEIPASEIDQLHVAGRVMWCGRAM